MNCGAPRSKVNSADPGFKKTDLDDNRGTQPVEVGPAEATRLALPDDNGPTGASFSKDGLDPGRPSPFIDSDALSCHMSV